MYDITFISHANTNGAITMCSMRQKLCHYIALCLASLTDFMKHLTLPSRSSMPLHSSGVLCKNAFVVLVRLLVIPMSRVWMTSLFSDAICFDKEGRKDVNSRVVFTRFITIQR